MATKMWVAIAAALLATLAPAASAQNRGEVIIQHQGMNDPMTEGWCPVNQFNQSVCTGINQPSGTGVIEDGEEAWRMDSIGGDTPGIYLVYDLFSDNPALQIEGWVYEARIKFVDNTGFGYVELSARDGDSIYSIILNNIGADGVVRWDSVDAYPVVPMGDMPEGFNDYKIAYDPSTNVVTLSMNGVDLFSGDRFDDYFGYSTDWTAFGDNPSSAGVSASTAFWASVKLSVVPEPTTLVLAAGGLLGLLGCRRRRRR